MLLALGLVAASLQIVSSAPAEAQNAGGFEIDGDRVPGNDNPAGADWNGVDAVRQTDPTGGTDDSFSGGNTEMTPPANWNVTQGNVGQSARDLTEVLA